MVLKHEKVRPKPFVRFILVENSCLNCFKVDGIQDYEKLEFDFFYFLMKKYMNRSES